MRSTWWILGAIVLVGALLYLKVADRQSPAAGRASTGGGGGGPAAAPLQRVAGAPGGAPAVPASGGVGSEAPVGAPEAAAREASARELLDRLRRAHESGDRARYGETLRQLETGEAWDAPSAREFAVGLGWNHLASAREREGSARVAELDRGRRLLSRGIWLPRYFTADGRPNEEREKLTSAITAANREVMTFDRRLGGGVPGFTRAYEVPAGWAPVQIVSREGLPYGHNALLWWNHDGNLDPRRLRAGEVLLLPTETLSLHVSLTWRRLAVFIGDWLVKEFPVGVGREDKPTPTGVFQVGPKEENPDWWSPGGLIRYGDPRNELGSAWIPITNGVYGRGAGYGLHGTNQPSTVGTRCSNGCVRLTNEGASELFWWVRTASSGGRATEVHVNP